MSFRAMNWTRTSPHSIERRLIYTITCNACGR
jgi:hypothetical protein